MRVLGFGASPLLSAMKRITGVDLVGDLVSFFALLGDMTDDFHRRATDVEQLLASPQTAFVLVSSAQPEPIEEAIWFHRTLAANRMPFAGAIVNRYHHELPDGALRKPAGLDAGLAERLAASLSDYRVLAERDAANVARLRGELGGESLVLVPHLDDDVHDMAGLARVERYLFASAQERARMVAELIGWG
jgi:anion-transporting  ArsA/GET3 family ATPase